MSALKKVGRILLVTGLVLAMVIPSTVSAAIKDIRSGNLRKIVFALVSSAENSSINYNEQYSYIEDIEDGRGYTAGVIGFTSGTGDLLEVVKKYVELKPKKNSLKKYITALEKVNGTDSHSGLGKAFVTAWEKAAKDTQMVQAQNAIVDSMYLKPAVKYANKDGLSILGQYIYYDALVVHGPGEDEESFGGIREAALKKCKTPSSGGEEETYLKAFLEARIVIMEREEAHSDLSRIDTQKKFLEEGNYSLKIPLQWSMYGDSFSLTDEELKELE